MKELSIIIPVYNVQKYLEDCLLSIYKQSLSLETFEVIAVNDGSTDSSIDILREYGEIYPNLTIISQENKGQSAARNTACHSRTIAAFSRSQPGKKVTQPCSLSENRNGSGNQKYSQQFAAAF